MMRKIVIGDPHGNHVGIQKILDKINYDPTTDKLIFTGDYIDGFPGDGFNVKKTIDLLLTLNNAHFILGNHDQWMKEWIDERNTWPKTIWYIQGGRATLACYDIPQAVSYNIASKNIPQEHVEFLNKLEMRYLDEDLVVVHGGFSNNAEMINVLSNQYCYTALWNRSFYKTGVKTLLDKYVEHFNNRIFVCGHTPYGPVINKKSNYPDRILIDGGSNGGGSLYAVVFDENKNYKIVVED